MEQGTANLPELSQRRTVLWRAPMPPSFASFIGRKLLRFIVTVQGLGAFALITLGVMVTKFGAASRVIHPLVRAHLSRSGVRLLPMVMFVSVALGLVVIGQTVSLLQRANTTQFLGTVMVTVVVRELGPLLTALIVLSRTGTANVIELGTARALGEVEGLEALGIDPVHYLVVPRVIGMALGIFSLTVYLILGALLSGYLWAFLQDVPLRPGDYFAQLAHSLRALDFIALALKTSLFGIIIATVTCYHGLAQPLRLEEVSGATIRAVGQSVILCMLLDALFIVVYLVA
ncbi:MAG TPA: ABC transporter permease [Methylomirabilota bacterium]|nr:ABC transporter permease [Methylomirabilota bacterium]